MSRRKKPKLHPLERQAAAIRKGQLRRARQIVAHHHPDERDDILAGNWDRGMGMTQALKDVQLVDRHGGSGDA